LATPASVVTARLVSVGGHGVVGAAVTASFSRIAVTAADPGVPAARPAPDNDRMDVTAKLQIKPGQRVAALAGPAALADVPSVVSADANPPADPGAADAVIAFARNQADLESVATPAVEAARLDKLAWIAYPKGGKLGTDLNRDILAALMTGRGVQPVRQVAIDETWSALRFRPA
jgi:hypothetical protein